MTAITDESVGEARRYEVVRQIVRGKNMSTIAKELGVNVSTVYKDFQYVRLNAMDYIDKFTSDIIPIEIMKCLTRVNMVSDAAWKIYEESDDERVQLMALDKAEKSAINIVNLITNNKDLVDIVYEMRGGQTKNQQQQQQQLQNEYSAGPSVEMKDVKKQSRLPGSVVKEFQEAVKRQEDAYETEYREQSDDEASVPEQQEEEELEREDA